MKKLLTVALVLLCLSGFAQTDTIPKFEGQYQYEGIVNVDSAIKKIELYNRSKIYFANAYKSAKDVIQYDDKEIGKVIGKGFIEFSEAKWLYSVQWDVYFSTEIQAKDGKYKYRLYDIYIKQYAGSTRIEDDFTLEELKNKKHIRSSGGLEPKLYLRMVKAMTGNVEDIKSYMSKKQVEDSF